MQITNIQIENIRGVESLEIKPGALTVVSGSNGQGKSSVIAAIQAVFEGGHDASLKRKGAKKGSVKLTLTDGTVVTRTITDKTSTLDVTTKDGDKKKAPAAYVSELATGFGLDPIRLLTAKPKERGAFLLETSNVTFQPAEIQKAINGEFGEALNLEGIDKLRKSIYDQRTTVNSRKKEAEAGAHGIKAAMPEDMDRDWVGELAQVESDLLDRSNELARLESEVKQQWESCRAELVAKYDAKIEKLKAERDAEIEALRENFATGKSEAAKDLSAEVAELTGKKSEAKAKADEQKRSVTLKQQYDASIKRYQELDRESDRLSKAIEKLDELKSKKLADDGIEGIEIVDGDIVVNGIPFDALNTATRYQLAFQIAARGAGSLPLMICDQAEVFDSAAWAEFCACAAESGMQIIAARVDDGPLDVKAVA